MNLTSKEYTEAAPLPCRSYIITLIDLPGCAAEGEMTWNI